MKTPLSSLFGNLLFRERTCTDYHVNTFREIKFQDQKDILVCTHHVVDQDPPSVRQSERLNNVDT